MAPAMFGVSVAQINLLLDTVLASLLTAGSVSWLYYSDRLVELPLGVFGVAIGTVILPALSKRHAEQSREHFARMLDWAIRAVLLLGLPAALALVVLAEPLLITLFHYGAMTDHDIDMAAMSLRAYAVGWWLHADQGAGAGVLCPPGYQDAGHDRHDRHGCQHGPQPDPDLPLAHAGLALATALSAFLNAGLLGGLLYRRGILVFQAGWGRYAVQLLGGCVAMGVTLAWLSPDWHQWLGWSLMTRVGWMGLLVVSGAAVYFAWLAATGVRLRHFRMKS